MRSVFVISRSLTTSKKLKIQSILNPGTIIPGLNYKKDQEPIKAKDIADYPEWLWDLAQVKSSEPEIKIDLLDRIKRRIEEEEMIENGTH